VISSYIVDSYPLQSMSVITFYAVFLNLSAFINPVSPHPASTITMPGSATAYREIDNQFFIAPWQASSGWTWTFAAQGIIVFGGIPVFALLQRFGGALRARSPQPSWVNPEFDTSI